MAKFKVTLSQHVLEMKTIIVEADSYTQAEEAARDGGEFQDGNGYTFQGIPDRWVEDVIEMETEDDNA